MATINAALTGGGTLSATLSAVNTLLAELTKTDTLNAELTVSGILSAELTGAATLSAALTLASSADFEIYGGPYTVTPMVKGQTLKTASKLMKDNVKVLSVPYWETSNPTGNTAYIAAEV